MTWRIPKPEVFRRAWESLTPEQAEDLGQTWGDRFLSYADNGTDPFSPTLKWAVHGGGGMGSVSDEVIVLQAPESDSSANAPRIVFGAGGELLADRGPTHRPSA